MDGNNVEYMKTDEMILLLKTIAASKPNGGAFLLKVALRLQALQLKVDLYEEDDQIR